MKIDWKKKLTSRKFWAAVAGFVSMLMIYFGKDAGAADQVAAIIMAAASLIAYMIGEGLADSATTYNTVSLPVPEEEDEPNPFAGCCGEDCKITFEEGGKDGASDG